VARNSRKAKKSTKTGKPKNTRKGRSARAMEQRISHSVNHPVRLDAMSILVERVASPKELQKMLRVPLGTASFHVKELFADDAIELVKTVQRRGAVEHYYRAKVRPEVTDEEWRAMPKPARRKFAATLLQAIVAEGLASLRHGMMDTDDDLYLVWMPVRLSAEGRDEVYELHAEMHERLEEVKARDEARQIEGEGDLPVRIVAMMGFERSRRGRPDGDNLKRRRGLGK
jgi:hypothetical protein